MQDWKRWVGVIAVIILFAKTGSPESALQVKPYEFKAADGTTVPAEIGEFTVPENRSSANTRKIVLRFVRFKSTSPDQNYPIIYLAGGPGGSGIDSARGSRFPLFMELRKYGDVIALDQRGVGMSEPDLSCKETYMIPFDHATNPVEAGKLLASAAKKCFDRHRASGIDLSAYNTQENAADLNDLRIALGASKIRLWGISYGTHLGLAAIKYHGEFIDRAILAGVEPLNHTLKLPSDQQDLMLDIAKRVQKDQDLIKNVETLSKELEAHPKTVSLTHPLNGMSANVTVGKFDLQNALAEMLVGPESFSGMGDFVSRLSHGDWTALALASAQTRMGTVPNAMSIAMDCASGANKDWIDQIHTEAQSTLLADAINFPFPQICEGLEIADLGEDFRAPFHSNVPVLMISGTLDGRTPVKNATMAASTLSNVQQLYLEGAGHSDPLFLSSPKIAQAMSEFLTGKKISEKSIKVPVPEMIPPRTIATLSDETLNRYVGTYQINEKESRRVIKAGSILYTQRGNGNPLPIRPMSDSTFFYEGRSSWIRFETDTQGTVTGMSMYQEGEQGAFSKKVVESSQKDTLKKSVESYLENYLKAGFFSGTILIAKKGEILLDQGYGMANYQFQAPNSPKTKYHIASVSKAFTAASIFILRGKGLLSLSDPLTKYIPDYPNGDKIQIQHLLGHKSGIPNVNDFPDYDEKTRSPHTLTEIISWFKDKPLEFQPGEKYSYSNSNYNLLAYIIEKVSGKSYGEFLSEQIFKPLEMTDTGHDGNPATLLPGAASGYVPVWINEMENAPYLNWVNKTGNGSLYSTVEDLYKWDRALYTDRILPQSAITEMSENGYGWFSGDRFGKKRYYMNGRSPGFNSYVERYIQDDVTIIMLCNQYTAVAHGIIADIAAIVFDQPFKVPEPFRQLPAEVMRKNAGKYEFGQDFYRPGTIEVLVDGNRLIGRWGGSYDVPLIPITESKYALLAFGAQIEFVRDAKGNVTEMVYRDSKEFHAKKL